MVLIAGNRDEKRGIGLRTLLLVGAVIWVMYLFAMPPFVGAGEGVSKEHLVKAAFVYNFFKFVRWPVEKDSLVLGVMGGGPMEEALNSLNGKKVGSRIIRVERLQGIGTVRGCSAVFVTRSWRGDMGRLLDNCKKNGGILTISDRPGFVEHGGIIGIVESGGRIRFEVNIKLAKQSQLFISSKLLKLAKRVVE